MSDIEREAFERIERQFTSGNSVSVDRASVRKEEWEAAKKYAARQAPACGEVEPAEIVSDIRHSADVDNYTTSQRKFLWSIADRLEKTFAHPPAKVPEGQWLITGETLYVRLTKDLSGGPDETFVDIEDGDGNSVRIERFEDGNDWLIGPLYEAPKVLTTPTPATTPETEWVKPTGRKHHDLKTDPSVFRQSLNGVKAWEIRSNDRDFVRGDTVTLHETENTGEEMAEGAPLVYTGRKITGVIGFVLNGPAYGLKPDWCVFSLLPTPPQEQ